MGYWFRILAGLAEDPDSVSRTHDVPLTATLAPGPPIHLFDSCS